MVHNFTEEQKEALTKIEDGLQVILLEIELIKSKWGGKLNDAVVKDLERLQRAADKIERGLLSLEGFTR